MTDFAHREDKVTQTSFESFTLIANWDEVNTYNTGQHTLAPLGFLSTSADGTLTAGVFTRYNGKPLTAGDHYLIEARNSDHIIVRQPLGADTSITLRFLPSWTRNDRITVQAYAETGQLIKRIPATVTSAGVTFRYRQRAAGQSVAFYKVVKLE